MDEKNLKRTLKSEMLNKMPRHIFNELVEEIQPTDEELSKNKLIDSLFEKYTVFQVKDLILDKYNEKESYSKYKEKFLNTLKRLGIDETPDSDMANEKEKDMENFFKKREEKREKNKNKNLHKKLKFPTLPGINIFHAYNTDVYFIYDYIYYNKREELKNMPNSLSKRVIGTIEINERLYDYKYYDKYENFFTEALLDAIESIINYYFTNKDSIVLISAPPSTKGTIPQTKKSIDLIEEWDKNSQFKSDIPINYCYNLLIRNITVESSKEGNRTVEKHLDSIIYNDSYDFSKDDVGIIILDDITNSGNTMYACKEILIRKGYENEDIVSLAIARTLRPHELKDNYSKVSIYYSQYVEGY